MLADTQIKTVSTPITASNRIIAAIFAAALGFSTLYGIGFAQSEVLHNAAHDARHAAGFPCH